ncbi:ferric reductase [candidate division WWE3 bacterium]|nr:ferric reductase [candidate division WWE3 bacterium]
MNILKKNVGWIVLIVLCLVPLVMWWPLIPMSLRFRKPVNTLTTITQISGLIGMVMFAYSLILSARIKIFEKLFGGLNRVYLAHHQIGGIAFILIMLHPLSVLAAYAPISLDLAIRYIIPSSDWANNFGLLAFVLLMAALVITYYTKLPYEIWRWTHKVLGISLAIGVLHTLQVSSDIKRNAPLRYYYLALIGIALVLFLYRSVLSRLLVKKYRYKVKSVTSPVANVVAIEFSPLAKPMTYEAGQFVFLQLKDKTVGMESHPFSIASAPTSTDLRIVIKSLGNYTAKLTAIQPGTEALIEGPFGRFNYTHYQFTNQIWVAGGIGITPFLSMAQSLQDPNYSVTLFYSVITEAELIYREIFEQIAANNPNFKFYPFISEKQKRITGDFVIEQAGYDITKTDFLVCGPPPMMKSLREQIHNRGVSYGRIHTEEFTMN